MLKDLCFEVIQACPNNCKFCSSNSSIEKRKIIKFDTFKKTVNYFMKQGGIEEISISGGEPFLHPDLFNMISFCKERGIRTVIFTSGIKKAEDMPVEMVEYIKNKCKKDLQEIEEKEPWNDRLKRNVKAYYERCIEPQTFGAITKQDCEKLKQLGVNKIVFDWQALDEVIDNHLMGRKRLNDYLNFVPQGRGEENKEELQLNEQELKEFSEILRREQEHYSGNIRIGIPLNGRISHLCTAGTEKLDIIYD